MAPTRFVHIGDVHLCRENGRNADRLAAFDQIVDETLALDRLGAVLIPGDLFHQKSTPADRNDLAARLVRLADVAPVCLTRGNHDVPGDLDVFAKLKAKWPVYLFTRPGVNYVPLATGETAAIAAVPYPDKAGLVTAGTEVDQVAMTALQLLDVIFMQLAHDLSVARVSGAIPIFIGHFNVRGSISSVGQPLIGAEPEVDRASLERLPVVYCALSHIHEPQAVGVGVYAGSIAAMDYGESTPRFYNVVEAVRAGAEWRASWHQCPINTPAMFHVSGRLDRDGFHLADDTEDEVWRRYDAMYWAGADVRVRYSYKASERSILDPSLVRAPFASAYRLKVEGVAEADRELRAPRVATAITLADKLAAYRQVEALESSIADKLELLEHAAPEQLLAGVEAAIAALSAEEATVLA